MSFSPIIPNELWSRIISFIPPPRRIRDFESSSFLPELLHHPRMSRGDEAATFASMMLVSKKMFHLTAPFFFSHAFLHYYDTSTLCDLLDEAKINNRPFLPAQLIKEITYEADIDEEAEENRPVFQDAVSLVSGLHARHLVSGEPTFTSHVQSLLINRPKLHTITGLVVSNRNWDGVVLLLASVASTLRHLQISSLPGEATLLARHSYSSNYQLHFPRLESLVIGTRTSRDDGFQDNLVASISTLWTMPSLSRLGVLGTGINLSLQGSSYAFNHLQSLSVERLEPFLLFQPHLASPSTQLSELSFTAQEVSYDEGYVKGMLDFIATLNPIPSVRTVLLRQSRTQTPPSVRPKTSAVIEAYLGPAMFPNLARVVWISKAAAEACPLLWTQCLTSDKRDPGRVQVGEVGRRCWDGLVGETEGRKGGSLGRDVRVPRMHTSLVVGLPSRSPTRRIGSAKGPLFVGRTRCFRSKEGRRRSDGLPDGFVSVFFLFGSQLYTLLVSFRGCTL